MQKWRGARVQKCNLTTGEFPIYIRPMNVLWIVYLTKADSFKLDSQLKIAESTYHLSLSLFTFRCLFRCSFVSVPVMPHIAQTQSEGTCVCEHASDIIAEVTGQYNVATQTTSTFFYSKFFPQILSASPVWTYVLICACMQISESFVNAHWIAGWWNNEAVQ
jgi:hypothetical protein